MTWQTKKLGEICDFEGGSQPPKSNFIHEPRNGYVRFLQIRDFTSDKHITYIPDSKKNRHCVENDILLGRYGASVGKILINKKGAYNVAVMKTIPDAQIINKSYFYYYLTSDEFQGPLGKVAARSAQAGFSKDDIYNFPVLTPPIPEQKRIVKILNEVFEKVEKAKENAEKNLKNSRELFESYLQSVFANPGKDWGEKRLGDVCTISSKLIDPRKKEFLEMVHVGAGNIETKTGQLIELKTAEEEKLISGKFLFDDKMVLYSKIRPYLMKVVRPDFDGLCSADIYPLLPIEELLSRDFLFYLLLSQEFTDFAVKGSARAGMPKVNREHLFSFEFFLPPLSNQKSIVAKLDALSAETKKLEAIYKQKLADLEELKKSVLKKAFSGEL